VSALWLAGGRQSRPAGITDRDHSPLYSEAVLARWERGRPPEVVATYRSPPEVAGPAVGHVFKGLSRDGDRWLACTERELVWFDDSGKPVDRLDHPWFNDVHHAVRHQGRVRVAVTGLDGVLEPESGRWWGPPIADRDWRRVDTRPHAVHPNHLFAHAGETWVTQFHAGEASSVTAGSALAVGAPRIHDGVVRDGRVWFTVVDGRLRGVSPADGTVDEIRMPGEHPMGWCRGLAPVPGGWAVGFTRLRATRWRHNLAWLRGTLRGDRTVTDQPTRVVVLEHGRVAEVLPVEALGLHALFAIEPGP
jgi:hypothetical protein